MVFAMRLLGLFMIYPVFANYARHLQGATPVTVGLSLGAYGLTQGLLQIPFGLLSDHIGRKIVIAAGLLLFAVGSIVAARSTTIDGVLLGRILQGGGAVGSVILALVADLTHEETRARAMGIVGVTIGLSFALAIAIGPPLASAIGVRGIFWLTAILALAGLGLTFGVVPDVPRIVHHRDVEAAPRLFARVVGDRELLRLDFAIFALHLILTASFLAVPNLIVSSLHLAEGEEWRVYLPILVGSLPIVMLVIIVAETGARMKEGLLAAIAVLAASLLMLAFARHIAILRAALFAFFATFNIMEALLPSLVTKFAPAGARGTATGIYSSSQFLGIFAGGIGGGLALGLGGTTGVFCLAATVALAWLAIAAMMRRPGQYSSYLVRLPAVSEADALADRLKAVAGVVDAVIDPDEGIAYLKIDLASFDEAAIARVIGC
jgi:predicted MFS family arabinose efflux permease